MTAAIGLNGLLAIRKMQGNFEGFYHAPLYPTCCWARDKLPCYYRRVIHQIIGQVNVAVDQLISDAEEATASAEGISTSSEEASKALAEVAGTAHSQAQMAGKLGAMVTTIRV